MNDISEDLDIIWLINEHREGRISDDEMLLGIKLKRLQNQSKYERRVAKRFDRPMTPRPRVDINKVVKYFRIDTNIGADETKN